MKIIGKCWSTKTDGTTNTTLQVVESFSDYYKDSTVGRFCEGENCDSIYVGSYDCSKIPIGAEVEIMYGKAMQTKTGGIYQPVKEIKILK